MTMEKADKQQVCSKLCFNLSTFLPVILVLVLFLFFFFFSISKSFPFLLTLPIALLCTMFLLTLTKRKACQLENLIQDEMLKKGLQPLLDATQTEVNQQSETVESHELQAEAQLDYPFPSDSESSNFSVVLMDNAFELSVQEHEPQADWQSDSSLPSDSESSAGSIMGGSFEIDHNGNQNVGSSDNLASDNDDDDDEEEEEEEEEDSLIEINLPNSNFSGLTEEPKKKLDSKLPDFLPESIFKPQDLMELLAEINEMSEDENLIEIDISMGSTNDQDFRLKEELGYLGDQCGLGD